MSMPRGPVLDMATKITDANDPTMGIAVMMRLLAMLSPTNSGGGGWISMRPWGMGGGSIRPSR